MGFWSEFKRGLLGDQTNRPLDRPVGFEGPRLPTNHELEMWFAAAEQQPRISTDVRHMIEHTNPRRWNRLQKDFVWMQKVMQRMGMNPDDARWYI